MSEVFTINKFLERFSFHQKHSCSSDLDIQDQIREFEAVYAALPKKPENVSVELLEKLCRALYAIPISCTSIIDNDKIAKILKIKNAIQMDGASIGSAGNEIPYIPFIYCYCEFKRLFFKDKPPKQEEKKEANQPAPENNISDGTNCKTIDTIKNKESTSFKKSEGSDYEANEFSAVKSTAVAVLNKLSGETGRKAEEYSDPIADFKGRIDELKHVWKTWKKDTLSLIHLYFELMSVCFVTLLHITEKGTEDTVADGINKVTFNFLKELLSKGIKNENNNDITDFFIQKMVFVRRFQIAAYIYDSKEQKICVKILEKENLPDSVLSIVELIEQYKETFANNDRIYNQLVDIADSVSCIQAALVLHSPPPKLVYYTSLSTFRYLLPQKMHINSEEFDKLNCDEFLKPTIMSVATMNDPEEGYYVQDYLAGNLDGHQRRHTFWWRENDDAEYTYNSKVHVFCRCFSPYERRDDLSMWETYGDRAKGCCAVVLCKKEEKDGTEFNAFSEVELFHICYFRSDSNNIKLVIASDNRRKREEIIETNIKVLREAIDFFKKDDDVKTAVRQLLLGIAYLFKDISYAHEREVRYLKYYIDQNDNDTHVDVQLIERNYADGKMPLLGIKAPFRLFFDEVILAPKVEEPNVVAAYLDYAFSWRFQCVRKFNETKGESEKIYNPECLTKITRSTINYR